MQCPSFSDFHWITASHHYSKITVKCCLHSSGMGHASSHSCGVMCESHGCGVMCESRGCGVMSENRIHMEWSKPGNTTPKLGPEHSSTRLVLRQYTSLKTICHSQSPLLCPRLCSCLRERLAQQVFAGSLLPCALCCLMRQHSNSPTTHSTKSWLHWLSPMTFYSQHQSS